MKQRKVFLVFLMTLVLLLTTAVPAAAGSTYRVQPGDSLFFIAQRFGTTIEALQAANGIWGDLIYTGETLRIPTGTRNHTVGWGESLWIIAGNYGTTVQALREANSLWHNEIYPGQRLSIPGTSSNQNGASSSPRVNFSDADVDLLARMIHAEAEGEPYTGKVAVGAVILNRINDPRFPNTLSGVLFAPWEFEPVMNNRFWQIRPDAEAYQAARDALSGWDPTGGAVFFYNPYLATSQWIFTRTVINRIGQHVFAV